jgi:hypothetical protein
MPNRGELAIPVSRLHAQPVSISRDLVVIIAICAIGLLVAICLTKFVPLPDDVGAILAQLS